MIEIEGTVVNIIYRNEENLYTVFRLNTNDGEITVVGKLFEINIGDILSITGDLVFHNDYGEQVNLKKYKKILPSSKEQIEKYLSSGVIDHIKEKRAKTLVEYFGEDALEVLSKSPDRLLEIPGIGEKTAKKIHESILKLEDSREVSLYLQKFNLGNKMMAQIYSKYKNEAIDIIEENPYQLVEDIRGIGFPTADKIAQSIGINHDSEFRIKAGISHILIEAANNDGDCYIEYDNLINRTSKLLGINKDKIESQIPYLVFENRINIETIDEKKLVYSSLIYQIEMNIVSKLLKLLKADNSLSDIDIDKEIKYIEKLENIEYSDTQKLAIKKAIEEKLMIITGGPGTGKTTIIKAIVSIIKNLRYDYALCAPTGRAAKRMEESTGEEASTIHRMLGYKSIDEDIMIEYNSENPLDVDVLIVDEVSMVDIFLMNNLLQALSDSTILIFVGDSDQLPSVGPGNILNDMIASNIIPVIKLNKIFRQGEGSNIVRNAHLINQGKYPILNEEGKDFFFVHTRNDKETLETIVDLVVNRLPNHYKVDPRKDIQILTPSRRGICGVDNINKRLQEKLNPEEFNKSEIKVKDNIFREHDKIMQIKNNYDIELKDHYLNTTKGLYNGDIGYIRNVFLDNKTIEAIYDDKVCIYTSKQFSEIVLSYTATIHKSQGSEFPIVIIPMANIPYMLLNRNILYTGITRGKSVVVLVGNENIMRKMINNNNIKKRKSTLDYNLKRSNDIYEEYYD